MVQRTPSIALIKCLFIRLIASLSSAAHRDIAELLFCNRSISIGYQPVLLGCAAGLRRDLVTMASDAGNGSADLEGLGLCGRHADGGGGRSREAHLPPRPHDRGKSSLVSKFLSRNLGYIFL